jgi:hypothetical protein
VTDCRDTVDADDATEKERPRGGQADKAGVGERQGEGDGEESRVNGGEGKAWPSVLKVGLREVLISYRRGLALAYSPGSMTVDIHPAPGHEMEHEME